jgi:hypothetical protein
VNDKVQQHAKGQAENDTSKLDWVAGRFACSLAGVFRNLRLQVEEDIKTRNGLRPPNSPYEFSVTDTNDGFTVALESKEVRKAVIFHLVEHAVLVRDDKHDLMFEVTLAFSDQGDCKLQVDHEQREYWQVRRMALEGLMFSSY